MSRIFIRKLNCEAIKRIKVIAGNYSAAVKICKILYSKYILNYKLLVFNYAVKISSCHRISKL